MWVIETSCLVVALLTAKFSGHTIYFLDGGDLENIETFAGRVSNIVARAHASSFMLI